MTTQIIIIFCEGPHDVAFLYRILKTQGFESNDVKIAKLPYPMNELVKSESIKSNIEEFNISQIGQGLLPSKNLIKEENHVFLYSLGGDGKRSVRKKFLKTLRSFIPANPGEIGALDEETSISVLYFFDADDKGIKVRIDKINTELQEALNEEFNNNLFETNAEIKTISQIKFGNFIFTGLDGDKGKLEDILLPLMQTDNDAIFKGAEDFLHTHFDENRLKELRTEKNAEGMIIEKRKKKQKFDLQKSLIGTVGQLQLSGISNVVCIRDTDYLTLEKINNNPKCQEIIKFFHQFLNE